VVNALSTYLNLGHQYYGIEICQKDDQRCFYLLKVVKKKNELVLKEGLEFTNYNALIGHMKKSIPVFLAINTQGIVTKSAERSTQKGKALANSLFPNMDYSSLFFETYSLKNQSFVSIVKKDGVLSILEQLASDGISIFGFGIGISAIHSILDFMDGTKIYGSTFELTLDSSSTMVTLSPSDHNKQGIYHVNGLEIKSSFLLAFGAVVCGMDHEAPHDSNFTEILASLRQEFKNKRQFSLFLKSSLVFILGLLLTNFLFFDFYYKKVQNLKDEKVLNESNIKRYGEVKNRLSQKENRVARALSSSNSRVSFYLDHIAQTVPNSITWDELVYQPLEKPKRPAQPITYELGEIEIIGMAQSRLDFIKWVGEMEKFQWIGAVETLEFDYQNGNSSLFKLNIKLYRENKD